MGGVETGTGWTGKKEEEGRMVREGDDKGWRYGRVSVVCCFFIVIEAAVVLTIILYSVSSFREGGFSQCICDMKSFGMN